MAMTQAEAQTYLDRNPGLYRDLVRTTRSVKRAYGIKKGSGELSFKDVAASYRESGGSFSNAYATAVSRIIMNNEPSLQGVFATAQ